jgi:hypothetical protein
MANYQFSADLIDDALFRAGEPTDGTSDYEAAALSYLNRAYQAVWKGGAEIEPQISEIWWWLLTEGTLMLDTQVTTGTVSVTANSAAITFSGTLTPSVATYWFRVGTGTVFKIATHTAGSASATLDQAYNGATNGTAAYALYKTDYALASDLLHLASPMRLTETNGVNNQYVEPGREFQIVGLIPRHMQSVFPLANAVAGVPFFFSHIAERTVRFNRYAGTSKIRIDYLYAQRPAALTNSVSEEPVVPLQHRKILADIVTFWLLLDKNDDRAPDALTMAKQGLAGMALENQSRLLVYGRVSFTGDSP